MSEYWVTVVFFFKQKTAYEIGTGDWSSDVCLPISITTSMALTFYYRDECVLEFLTPHGVNEWVEH